MSEFFGKSSLNALDRFCRATSTKVLKQLELTIGTLPDSSVNEEKHILRNQVMHQGQMLDCLQQRLLAKSKVNVVCVQPSFSEIAFSVFSLHSKLRIPMLHDWGIIDEKSYMLPRNRERRTLQPMDIYYSMRNLRDYLVEVNPDCDLFYVQRPKVVEKYGELRLGPILRANFYEQVLFSLLNEKLGARTLVCSSNMNCIDTYWTCLTPIRRNLAQQFKQIDPQVARLKIKSSEVIDTLMTGITTAVLQGAIGLSETQLISITSDWESRLQNYIPGNDKFSILETLAIDDPKVSVANLSKVFLQGLGTMQWLERYTRLSELLLEGDLRGKKDDIESFVKNEKRKIAEFQIRNSPFLDQIR